MTVRKPLVYLNGEISTLPSADSINVKIPDVLTPDAFKINNPNTLNNLKDILDRLWGSGAITGFAPTDNLNGTISLAEGTIIVRASASETANFFLIRINATSNLVLTNNVTNYVYVDYNAGTPIVVASTDISSFNGLDKVLIYLVSREDNHIHVVDYTRQNVDSNRKLIRRFIEAEPFKHVPGGSILGVVGLALTLTAGRFWSALEPIDHISFNTTLAGTTEDRTFYEYYRNGTGGWAKNSEIKLVSNSLFDNGTGTLATVGNNKFLVHWIFLNVGSDPHLSLVYGQAEYASLAAAQSSSVPAELPAAFSSTTILVGRLILVKGANTVTSVENPFSTDFTSSTATDHNYLANLNVGDYQHLSILEKASFDTLVSTAVVDGDIGVTVAAFTHNHTLDSLSNVTISTAAVGNVVLWSGTTWVNAEHNSISGLNAGEYKHLTASEYTGTGTGVFVRKTNPALNLSTTTKTADYTVQLTDYTIRCNATSASITITLPSASTCTGQIFIVKKIDGSSNSVVLSSSDTIDGSTSAPIYIRYASITVQSNGVSYDII